MEAPETHTKVENWTEVLPHRNDVLLENIDIFKDYLVIGERSNGLNQIRIKRWDGKEDYYDAPKHSAEERMISKIQSEVESWEHWYDRKLFKIYYETDISMRKLAKETNISVTSIFNSCKNYKELIKSKFGEDFEDYLNGDFDLIKTNKDE